VFGLNIITKMNHNLFYAWSDFVEKVRQFFRSKGYLEVSTPILQSYPNVDPNIEPLKVNLTLRGQTKSYWLHTSPEHAMKKLLAIFPKICFR
jgi:Truncated, possibly inactive, lysyl-tRNA synthetase (class II)